MVAWLALPVTSAHEQKRVQVAALAEQVQRITGESVEVAYVDQGYSGAATAEQPWAQGIRLEGVRHTEAKQGFILLPRRWGGSRWDALRASTADRGRR